jgi:hypothetical protein
MSSVGRFIRQINNNSHYVSAAVVAAAPGTYAYELVPTSSAVNYPPGFVRHNSDLTTAINNLVTAATGAAKLVLRDMGKTVRANKDTADGALGFFRQVQLLNPLLPNNYIVFYTPVVVDGLCSTVVANDVHPLSGQM